MSWTRRAALMAGTAAAFAAAPASADTLREALVDAYNSNPTLQAARAQQRAQDETVPIQKSTGLPSANATVTHIEFLRQSGNAFTAPERNLGIGVGVTMPVYTGGAFKNNLRAAEERIEAGKAELRGTESSLFSQVVSAYMNIIRNEAVVALSANQVEVLEINFQATSDRFEIGDLTRTDVAQSQSRLALAQSDLRIAKVDLANAREVYIQLVGREPGDLEAPPPLPGLPDSADEAVMIALDSNPDLIAARERTAASRYDVKATDANRLPTVSLFANGDYSNFYGTLGGPASNSFRQAETTANAGVQVSIPLFQGGRPAALKRQAQARSSATMEQEIATERAVIANVRAAYGNWRTSREIIQSTLVAVEAAELSLEGVQAENTVGNRTILDILDAQRELLSAQVQLVTARRNEYVAGFTLLAAMGKAEARDLNLDTGGPLYDPDVNLERVSNMKVTGPSDLFWDWRDDPDPVPQGTRTIDSSTQDGEIGRDTNKGL